MPKRFSHIKQTTKYQHICLPTRLQGNHMLLRKLVEMSKASKCKISGCILHKNIISSYTSLCNFGYFEMSSSSQEILATLGSGSPEEKPEPSSTPSAIVLSPSGGNDPVTILPYPEISCNYCKKKLSLPITSVQQMNSISRRIWF